MCCLRKRHGPEPGGHPHYGHDGLDGAKLARESKQINEANPTFDDVGLLPGKQMSTKRGAVAPV